MFIKKENKLIHILQSSDPFLAYCTKTDCFSCQSAKNDKFQKVHDCRKQGVGYTVQCNLCKEYKIMKTYEGETCRYLYLRGREHLRLLHKKSEKVHYGSIWKYIIVKMSQNLA